MPPKRDSNGARGAVVALLSHRAPAREPPAEPKQPRTSCLASALGRLPAFLGQETSSSDGASETTRQTSFYDDATLVLADRRAEPTACAHPCLRWLCDWRPRARRPVLLRMSPPKSMDRFVIHPFNRVKLCFDVLIIVCVAYTSFTMPIKITYGTDFLPDIETAVDVLFVLDVVLTFFHGYVDTGYPVLDLRRVSLRYMRSWFLIDLIASIPFDAFNPNLRSLQLIKSLRLFRVQRMLRKYARVAASNTLRVGLTLTTWVFVAHAMSCIYYLIGYVSLCDWEWYETTWISTYWELLNKTTLCEERKLGRVVAVPITSRYIKGLYWALATMSSLGYGTSPVAITDAEYLFSMLCQMLGACIYAFIFGKIAQLIQKLDAWGTRYQGQLDQISEFMRFHRLPNNLCDKLHAYNNFLFSVHQGFDITQIAAALPPTLQNDIYLAMYEPLVRRVPMFETCDEGFIKALCKQLKPQVLLEGDCVFRAHELADMMYFIQNGCIQIVSGDETVVYHTLIEGAYFGELSMLTSQRRTATARALMDCILFFMTFDDFEKAVEGYPSYLNEILEKAISRLESTLKEDEKECAMKAAQTTKQSLVSQRSNKTAITIRVEDAPQVSACAAVGSEKCKHESPSRAKKASVGTHPATAPEQASTAECPPPPPPGAKVTPLACEPPLASTEPCAGAQRNPLVATLPRERRVATRAPDARSDHANGAKDGTRACDAALTESRAQGAAPQPASPPASPPKRCSGMKRASGTGSARASALGLVPRQHGDVVLTKSCVDSKEWLHRAAADSEAVSSTPFGRRSAPLSYAQVARERVTDKMHIPQARA
ncbi:hypothetical protein AB1Y20_006593 [Prymnesium parvum]|uniref:Cyclic nucleotide-binding domain-containing protein n=1 Tax=Prymnesium parvum TaxID=97485 RepID=A0AB34IZA2_PRYPA